MANIYYLNRPPHPMWNFITDLGEHGLNMFAQPPPYPTREHGNQHNTSQQDQTNSPHSQPQSGAHSVHNPEQNRSEPRTRGLGENTHKEGVQEENSWGGPSHAHGCRRGRGRFGHPGWEHPGRGRRHRHGRHGGNAWWGNFSNTPEDQGQSSGGNAEFMQNNLEFLKNLGNQFGINFDEILNNQQSSKDEADFVPRADVFNTTNQYIVHVSLPGAQKKDISVDYDTEHSTLRLAGVVYRPGIDEELSNALVVDGRSREVGVFEREIHLGTRDQPAHIDADNIGAKLSDGVLTLTLPKIVVDRDTFRRRVSVEQIRNEKDQGFDGEKEKAEWKGKEKEIEKEAEPQPMQVDSETEAGDEVVSKGRKSPPSPSVRSEEEEEREYITVDVD
ncbi:hypothetical protein FQN51_005846 [Onygenales sp. PD_10]|nr:hypothetical protein FQN51_005846 [Onygenales sp. PD_10]